MGRLTLNFRVISRREVEEDSPLQATFVPAEHQAMDSETMTCPGVIVYHLDEETTCTEPGCDAAPPVSDRHQWFVLCTQVFGSECEICHPVPTESDQSEAGHPASVGQANP